MRNAPREVLVDRILYVDTLHGNAGLAAVRERSGEQSGRRFVQWGAFEDDHRILAAKLKRIWNQTLRGGNRDLPSSDRATRKPHIVDVPDQLRTRFAGAIHDDGKIEIEPAFHKKVTCKCSRQRCQL